MCLCVCVCVYVFVCVCVWGGRADITGKVSCECVTGRGSVWGVRGSGGAALFTLVPTTEVIVHCHLVIIPARQNSFCFNCDVLMGLRLGVRELQATHIRWRSEVNVDFLIPLMGFLQPFQRDGKRGGKSDGADNVI